MVVAELSMAFPWGLCLVEDPETADAPPDFAPDEIVSVARTAMAVGVRHEQEGDAVVRLRRGSDAESGIQVFDGEIESRSGRIRLTEATGERYVEARVEVGRHRVRVFVDDRLEPTRVDVILG